MLALFSKIRVEWKQARAIRRSRIVVVSQSNRTHIVISITSFVVECVVISSYRSRVVGLVESHLWYRLTKRLRSDYDVSRAPASILYAIRREQKINMSIFRRSLAVVVSQSNRNCNHSIDWWRTFLIHSVFWCSTVTVAGMWLNIGSTIKNRWRGFAVERPLTFVLHAVLAARRRSRRDQLTGSGTSWPVSFWSFPFISPPSSSESSRYGASQNTFDKIYIIKGDMFVCLFVCSVWPAKRLGRSRPNLSHALVSTQGVFLARSMSRSFTYACESDRSTKHPQSDT